MPTIFRKNAAGEWCGEGVPHVESDSAGTADMRFVAFMAQGRQQAAVFAPADSDAAFVNGEPIIGRLCLLAHQDEIYLPPERFWFSAEERPRIVRHEATDDRAARCSLCRDEIAPGDEIVQCPRCGRRYHQSSGAETDARRCWTYKDKCVCDHPTSLSWETAWTPASEE